MSILGSFNGFNLVSLPCAIKPGRGVAVLN